MPDMNAITQTLESLQIAQAQHYGNLTLLPLVETEAIPQPYLTLDEALEQHLARVTELTESGVVPELRFDNLSDQRILLLDGEELVGAKQNRVLNITILVAGHARSSSPSPAWNAGAGITSRASSIRPSATYTPVPAPRRWSR
jgi:hypothetical protein